MKKKTFAHAMACTVCAVFTWTTACLAQNSDPKDVSSSKETAVTQKKEPFMQFIVGGGYISQYNFRGTNLMPKSDGGNFYSAEATIPKWHLTLGLYGIHQIGTASADAWSISEGGGGGGLRGLWSQTLEAEALSLTPDFLRLHNAVFMRSIIAPLASCSLRSQRSTKQGG